MKHLSINVTGKVQGVYFRASTKQKADELGLQGTVMNLPNGSVQIEVVGTETTIEQFIKWCNEGPERAEVKEVNCIQIEELGAYTNFKVKWKN